MWEGEGVGRAECLVLGTVTGARFTLMCVSGWNQSSPPTLVTAGTGPGMHKGASLQPQIEKNEGVGCGTP